MYIYIDGDSVPKFNVFLFPSLSICKNFRFSVKFLLAPGINQKHFQTYDSENLIIFLKWAY